MCLNPFALQPDIPGLTPSHLAPQIQYFSRAFQPLRNSFLETIRAVIIAVRWFLVLLLVTLWGFAGAQL